MDQGKLNNRHFNSEGDVQAEQEEVEQEEAMQK